MKPTQVLFIDEEDTLCAGIAYDDVIICACCGSVYEQEEVEILCELPWVNFSQVISKIRLDK